MYFCNFAFICRTVCDCHVNTLLCSHSRKSFMYLPSIKNIFTSIKFSMSVWECLFQVNRVKVIYFMKCFGLVMIIELQHVREKLDIRNILPLNPAKNVKSFNDP